MKSKLVLLTLLAAPTLALAQTNAPPVRVAALQEPMPKAQELLDNLFAPYAAAKTFSGNFDVEIKGEGKANAISEIHLETRYRFNENGDLQNEDSTTSFVGSADSGQKTQLRVIHDGTSNVGALPDKKVWWEKGAREAGAKTELSSTLKPILDSISQLFSENDVSLVISKSADAGRPVWILKVKGRNGFRIVIDQQTRALRLLEVVGSLSIRGSEQTFDAPMTEDSFTWIPPADFRKVQESEAVALFPEFMRNLLTNSTANIATPTG